jgi:hypothetical protein
MKFARVLFVLTGVVALLVAGLRGANAESVRVGDSLLIDTLDYSDTYTLTDHGGLGPGFATR